MRTVKLLSHSVLTVLLFISVCCMIVLIMSMYKLPDIPIEGNEFQSEVSQQFEDLNLEYENLGKFGEMMVDMLPDDLAFTVFVPSEKAFEHDLRLRVNHSFAPEEWDNTYATVSRVLGFSVIPRKIYADLVPLGKEVLYDSISGFRLHIRKDLDGVLVVNSLRMERVDIEKGEVVVHIMNGVVMDAEFEQAVLPDDDELQ